MLCIQYFDKKRFMEQVAASRGSVFLHMADGTICDIKHNPMAASMLMTMEAPADGIRLSFADPDDMGGFFRYMMEAGRCA